MLYECMPRYDKDFLEYSIYYIFKAVGIAPMKLRVVPAKHGRTRIQATYSMHGFLYSLLLLCLALVLGYCNVSYAREFAGYGMRDKFERLFETLQMSMSIAATAVIWIVFCGRQRKIIRIIEDVRDCLGLLLYSCRDYPGRFAWLVAILILSIHCASCAMEIMQYREDELNREIVVYIVSAWLGSLVISYTLQQFCLIFKFIGKNFQDLNEDLTRIARATGDGGSGAGRKIAFVREKSESGEFSRLHRLHVSLCEVSEDLSDFGAWPILFSVSYYFLDLVYYGYYITKPFVIENVALSRVQTIIAPLMSVYDIIILLSITQSVTSIMVESSKTKKIMNKFLANLSDRELELKLTSFSNYLLNQNLKFTAFGLFPLNNSLLMSIASSITTYLVIVLQFQNKA